VRDPVGCQFDGEICAMDTLPVWAVSIVALAVGLAPGLAFLCAPMIAPLIHRAAAPRRELTPKPQPGRPKSRPAPQGDVGREPGADCGGASDPRSKAGVRSRP
jgi:hypothetical protein